MFEPKSYLLKNGIQNYEWGKKGKNSIIPNLIGFDPDEDMSYAELWIGAHNTLPSTVKLNNEFKPLNKLISEYPQEILGSKVVQKFGPQLPFLFKVLSAGDALSIQTHPTIKQAEKLHSEQPEFYPDANHKPEIAIALDELTALLGIKKYDSFIEALNEYFEIKEYIGADFVENTFSSSEQKIEKRKKIIQELLKKSLNDSTGLIKKIDEMNYRIKLKDQNTKAESLFLLLNEKYSDGDVGLFMLFLMNLCTLQKGEAVFLSPGIPHAYIDGNIVECMANSDNVIRVGLTPKYKDVNSLIEIMDYESDEIPVISPHNEDVKIYQTDAEEFQITSIKLTDGKYFEYVTNNKPVVFLICTNKVDLIIENNQTIYKKGDTVLIPASVEKCELKSEDSEIFMVEIPD